MRKLSTVIFLVVSSLAVAQYETTEFEDTFLWTGELGETEAESCKVPLQMAYDWIQDWRLQDEGSPTDKDLNRYSMGDCSCEEETYDGESQYTCSVDAKAVFYYPGSEDE